MAARYDTDITIKEIKLFHRDAPCRTPLKFGAVVVTNLPMCYARATVENRRGQTAVGWGAMPLMDLWAWPLGEASHEAKNAVMFRLAAEYARLVEGHKGPAHPIEFFVETEGELEKLSRRIAEEDTPGTDMPFLAAVVCASPIDHALHDAFGNVNGIDSYHGYGKDFMAWDLSRYLGDAYTGVYPAQFLRAGYEAELPVFHLVGALDWLTEDEVPSDAPQDGIPNSLVEWIKRDGVFCLKVKLKGTDGDWDFERTRAVSRIYHEVRREMPSLRERPFMSVDTNEQCRTPDYMVEYLNRLSADAPETFEEILYVEQPTERDLAAHRWDMRPIAELKPVIIDESLSTLKDYDLARELGWSGIALKSCKCLSSDLLFIARAETEGIAYAVQDLTCPSISLLESIGLAARIHTILGVEANSRQFAPAANEPEANVHPDICRVRNGVVRTESLQGTGLGFRMAEIDREFD